jgi:hypothetical protein
LAKTKTALLAGNQCGYKCENGQWVLKVNNAPPGFYCPTSLPSGCNNGDTKSTPAIAIPDPDSISLVANSAEYIYRKSTTSLHFKAGTCGKGKFFPTEISAKDLAKVDPDAAELVKLMQKNKRIASFSIVLKAQKFEQA